MSRLLLFARRPRRGRVKTRLVPPLDADQALALYRAFLDDQVAFLHSFQGRCGVELWLDGPWGESDLAGLPLDDVELHEQGRGDLGRRLARAFAARTGPTVVIGVDSPTLPATIVERSLDLLAPSRPAVISPAADGGYVLLGLYEPHEELFAGVSWGGPEVLEQTRRRARDAGLPLAELPGWYDVDDRAGLKRLRAELTRPEAAERAPATRQALERLLDARRGRVV